MNKKIYYPSGFNPLISSDLRESDKAVTVNYCIKKEIQKVKKYYLTFFNCLISNDLRQWGDKAFDRQSLNRK